jgi:hypothetical protein
MALASVCLDRAAPLIRRRIRERPLGAREAVREHHNEAVVPERGLPPSLGHGRLCARATGPRYLRSQQRVRRRAGLVMSGCDACTGVIRSPYLDRLPAVDRDTPVASRYDVLLPGSPPHGAQLARPRPRRPSSCIALAGLLASGRPSTAPAVAAPRRGKPLVVATCEVSDAGVGCLGGAGPVLCAVNRHVLRFRGDVFGGRLGRCSARSAPLAGV